MQFILQGIQEGFRVGFDNSQPLQPVYLRTVDSSIITNYLSNEVRLNRLWRYPRNFIPRSHVTGTLLSSVPRTPLYWVSY